MWTNVFSITLRVAFLVVASLGCHVPVQSQSSPHWDQLSQEEGLSQSYVTCMLQDRLGFMWFGTADGLNRYDGLQFKSWFHRAKDPGSLSHNLIDALLEDRQGNLWIGTQDGLNCYRPNQDTFERFYHQPTNPNSLANNKIWALLADKQGFIWIGTRNGLDRFDPVHRQFTHFPFREQNPNGISHPQIRSLYQDRQGMIWIGTFGGGLNRYNPRTHRFTVYRHQPANPQSLSHDVVTSLYEDRQGRFWVATYGGGLNRMNRAEGTFRTFQNQPGNPGSLSHNAIYTLLEDRQGQFWVGTDGGGLNRFDRNRELFTRYTSTPTQQNGLSSPVIKTIFQDRQQNLWLGTWQGGINVRYAARQPFRLFKSTEYATRGGRNELVMGFVEDGSGAVWIDLDGTGLSRFDPTTDQFTYFPRVAAAGRTPFTDITDMQGKVWSITRSSPWSHWLDRRTGRLVPCGPGNDGSVSPPIDKLLIDQRKNFWLMNQQGAFRFDHRQRCYQAYRHDPARPGSLAMGSTSAILEDSQHQIWLGVANGIDRFDSLTHQFIHYTYDALDQYGGAVGICQNSHGLIWVISREGHLFRLDPGQGPRAALHHQRALGQGAMGIVVDAHNRLWISTRRGLFRYNPENSSLRRYDHQDGLQSDEFLQESILKARNGLIYAGGVGGFTLFDPLQIQQNPYLPPVVLTDFRLASQAVPIRRSPADTLTQKSPLNTAIPYVDRLELAHDQNDFSVGFAALNYYQSRKNRFRYRLKGYDARWQETDGTHPLAAYTNIDPGSYTFEVQAANNDGVWNPQSRLLGLLIHRPWWASYWAYGVYGVLFVLIGYQALRRYRHRLRVSQLARQQAYQVEQEREMSAVKTRFFENITHEFRTPLTLILTPTQQLKEQLHDPDQAMQNNRRLDTIDRSAHQLLSLVNQLLDLSKLEARTLPVTESVGDLVAFVQTIVDPFQTQAEIRSIQLTFVATQLAPAWYFDPAILERIVVNLLANALKFTGEGGSVSVKLAPLDAGIQLTVTDTGVGIPPDDLPRIFDRFYQATTGPLNPPGSSAAATPLPESTGIGLALVSELVQLQQGQISVESQVSRGTTFTVELPYRLASLPTSPAHADDPTLLSADTDENPRVLVVEDNPDLRQLITESFPAHYTLLSAVHGQDGFEQAVEQLPDLIISDVLMPVMDGYTLVRQLKRDWRTSHIPVLLLTAKSASSSRLEGLSLGADDYLSKPFQTEELQWRVHNRLEQVRHLRNWLKASLTKPDTDQTTPEPPPDPFLTAVYAILEENVADSTFGPEALVAALGQSRMSVYRKLKAVTGMSASECIRSYRLKRACAYLQQRVSIADTAYRVGFESPAYFAKCFREAYHQTPSEFARSQMLS